jgi:OOP family OmpA-OmpF porin
MKFQPLLHLLALASLGSLVATPAAAQDSRYFLLGAGVGQSRENFDERQVATGVLGGNPNSVAGISSKNHDTAYKLFGGYQFNRYFGVEAGYFDLGAFHLHADTVPAGTLDGRMRVSGAFGDAVFTLPVGDSFALLGRVGGQYAKSRNSFNGTGGGATTNTQPSKREGNAKVGLGVQWAITSGVILRGEAERYRVADPVGNRGNVDMVSVSLIFPIGRTPMSAPRAAAPAYMPPVAQAAPMPEPVVMPMPATAPMAAFAPPVATRRRVSFSAESLFVFDKSDVQPDGRVALDAFAKELDGTEFVTINIEGYADRIGTTAYNQTLSEQRAEAVKAYLVSAGHVDAAKITVAGKGESMPVTKPEDCKGNTANAKLIACLQPDRRVDIEVTGTR